ncbi:MAG TPA: DUF6058 family natural product biosynthesis protein [Telluria sp.]|nr:DUF6058 family natural product biosynthesis protein [Telluria sp.]
MNLLTYLHTHFLTRAQLIDAAGCSDAELAAWQETGVMPRASYRLALTLGCDSFFGHHDEAEHIEFYARGYPAWIGLLQGGADAFGHFTRRYRARLQSLPLRSAAAKLNADLDAHLRDEWNHFLAGTYGLCTRTGLPEQIAEKELAIAVINELTAAPDPDRVRLKQAVDLLDAASSPFAPHERARSSRHRLVDQVRLRYGLAAVN